MTQFQPKENKEVEDRKLSEKSSSASHALAPKLRRPCAGPIKIGYQLSALALQTRWQLLIISFDREKRY